MSEAKSFQISKREVYEAWKAVKSNGGAGGVDGQSISDFEVNLVGNLYKLWNRMSAGSYLPPPVRGVEILHYAFDLWMARTFPSVPFVRYADDGLLH